MRAANLSSIKDGALRQRQNSEQQHRPKARVDEPAYPLLLALQRFTAQVEYYAARMRRGSGVGRTDMHALAAVVDAERVDQVMTPGLLGRLLGLSSSSITALVDRLYNAGHLNRSVLPDARRVGLTSTPSAREAGYEVFTSLDDALMDTFAKYSDEEIELFGRMLADITDATHAAGREDEGTRGRRTGSRTTPKQPDVNVSVNKLAAD